jgi:hypothetical protein
MPTPKKVFDIKSNLLRPALTSHFEVQLGIPPGGEFANFLNDNGVNYNTNQGKLNLMCSEATLPGSNLATLEINNDFTGVTERHVHRRVYDDRIDLTFYVDAQDYLPIRFFETWMKYIVDESFAKQSDKGVGSKDPNYFYRVRYPDGNGNGNGGYVASGLKVIKFERDYKSTLEYEFIRSFPVSMASMPVSYDSSSLLKCTVSMSYIRYVLIQGKPEDKSSQTDNFNLTPQQLADLNGQAFNPNINLSSLGNFTSTGGVNFDSAAVSGNSINVQDAYSGNYTLNV